MSAESQVRHAKKRSPVLKGLIPCASHIMLSSEVSKPVGGIPDNYIS
jgi:hypothetical protein